MVEEGRKGYAADPRPVNASTAFKKRSMFFAGDWELLPEKWTSWHVTCLLSRLSVTARAEVYAFLSQKRRNIYKNTKYTSRKVRFFYVQISNGVQCRLVELSLSA
jgi:hypothetical protein